MKQYDDDDDKRDKYVLKDGERLVVNMMAMDALGRAVSQAMTRVIAGDGTDPLAMHKPGPRRLADQAADDRSARSYAEMVKRMSDNWRTPERAKADAERDCIIARDEITFDDYRRRSEEAYARMVARMQNAWRNP